MQRGARFAVSDVPVSASCWAHRGCQKCCKTNAFLSILNMRGGQEMDAEKHCQQNTSGKTMFWAHTLGANWVPLWWFVFSVQGSGAPMGFTKNIKKCWKYNGLGDFWVTLLRDPSGLLKLCKRSHAAWRSFSNLPEHSHAAWRSFSDPKTFCT